MFFVYVQLISNRYYVLQLGYALSFYIYNILLMELYSVFKNPDGHVSLNYMMCSFLVLDLKCKCHYIYGSAFFSLICYSEFDTHVNIFRFL